MNIGILNVGISNPFRLCRQTKLSGQYWFLELHCAANQGVSRFSSSVTSLCQGIPQNISLTGGNTKDAIPNTKYAMPNTKYTMPNTKYAKHECDGKS